MEGPPFQDYDPTTAIHLSAASATRGPNQSKKKSYKAESLRKGGTVLISVGSWTLYIFLELIRFLLFRLKPQQSAFISLIAQRC